MIAAMDDDEQYATLNVDNIDPQLLQYTVYTRDYRSARRLSYYERTLSGYFDAYENSETPRL